MQFMNYTFDLDDLTKAHICIKSKSPVITSNKLFNDIQAQSELTELNIDVKPSEIGDFIINLADEVKVRRQCLAEYKKLRVSDIADKPTTLVKANIVLILPRTLSNQNLSTLGDMLSYAVPLDIHFYIILPTDVQEKVFRSIANKCYWVLDEGTKELQHK